VRLMAAAVAADILPVAPQAVPAVVRNPEAGMAAQAMVSMPPPKGARQTKCSPTEARKALQR
jgi:hypothetical protein